MTKEEFDNYNFSVNTEINYFKDGWENIVEVDCRARHVGIDRGKIVGYDEIKGIRPEIKVN